MEPGGISIWIWTTLLFAFAAAWLAVVLWRRNWSEGRRATEDERDALESRCALLEAKLNQSQRLETVATLAHTVSHDYSNLLTIMTLQAGRLMDVARKDEEAAEALDLLNHAIEAAGDLTSALVSFSRKQSPQRRNCSLNHAIREGVRLLQRAVPADVSIRLELNDEDTELLADRVQLQQVVINLLINGLEAMPRGGTLTVRSSLRSLSETRALTFPEGRAGQFLLMSVEDTGVGLEESVVSRMFEPGFSGPTSRTKSGVGLSIVQSIVRAHDGWIDVHSRVGEGTQFHIYWPVAEASDEELKDSIQAAGRGQTILIIDDQSLVLAHSRTQLEQSGFRVLVAGHIEGAAKLLLEHRETEAVVVSSSIIESSDQNQLGRFNDARNGARILFIDEGGFEAGHYPCRLVREEFQVLRQPFALTDLISGLAALLDVDTSNRVKSTSGT